MKYIPNSITLYYTDNNDIGKYNNNNNDSNNNSNNNNNSNDNSSSECLLDPIAIEENNSMSLFVYTVNPSISFIENNSINNKNNNEKKDDNNDNNRYGIINMHTYGNITVEQLNNSILIAKKSSNILHEFLRKIISNKLDINVGNSE